MSPLLKPLVSVARSFGMIVENKAQRETSSAAERACFLCAATAIRATAAVSPLLHHFPPAARFRSNEFLLRLDVVFFHHLRPARELALDVRSELRRRARNDISAFLFET